MERGIYHFSTSNTLHIASISWIIRYSVGVSVQWFISLSTNEFDTFLDWNNVCLFIIPLIIKCSYVSHIHELVTFVSWIYCKIDLDVKLKILAVSNKYESFLWQPDSQTLSENVSRLLSHRYRVLQTNRGHFKDWTQLASLGRQVVFNI